MKMSSPTTKPWTPSADTSRDVAVMMSGGVDSSATALLLKSEGWNVLGVTMSIPRAQGCDAKRSCCGMEAGYVAQALDIPHYFIDVREEFERLVIEPFRRWYLDGRTPSPCVDCNTDLKFGVVWDCIREQFGIEHLATGHYAIVTTEGNEAYLSRAADRSKDQSYFLYGICRERLGRLLLPLGGLTKTQVRKITREAGLPVARRQDSMELCFAGEQDYRKAIALEKQEPGPIVDADGNRIGTHSGIANFTIGQRKGIGIAAREALFVVGIRAEDHSVTVGPREKLHSTEVTAGCVNVLIPEELAAGTRLRGKIRSQGEPAACVVSESDGDRVSVTFDEPQFAPTPGQRLVLYDNQDRVVAGGVIG